MGRSLVRALVSASTTASTKEAQRHGARQRGHVLDASRVQGVVGGSCKHTRLRERWEGVGETLWHRDGAGYWPGKTSQIAGSDANRRFYCCSCGVEVKVT